MDLAGKLDVLHRTLSSYDGVVVAFSGGADSAFLLAAAARALPRPKVVAATAVSASLPAVELASAADFAASLGVAHHLPSTDEISRPGYRANDGDRCFHCKAELLDTLRPLADSLGIATVATGTNADDVVVGFRPGIRAAAERGAVTPLLDAGLSKAQVREASYAWGLPTWDKPAAACLSSRVAFGVEISPMRLSRVERAEAAARTWLRDAGIAVRDLRVRDLGDAARLEVDAAALPAVLRRAEDVCEVLVLAGFDRAEVDPAGFRSGSMNVLLADPARFR
ncbi:MAG TPA: ATP-dependent sacrificial sulfur transferase LarE [Mycobacteriales bacterium]|nr:ATP-dependent sacrificial sulfur transferase LarE [Mycobacteriales bacterium]